MISSKICSLQNQEMTAVSYLEDRPRDHREEWGYSVWVLAAMWNRAAPLWVTVSVCLAPCRQTCSEVAEGLAESNFLTPVLNSQGMKKITLCNTDKYKNQAGVNLTPPPIIIIIIIRSTTLPSVLWRCWLGGRKGIRPVKNWVVGCWRGYLSGARCRFAYGPADVTATHCLLLQ